MRRKHVVGGLILLFASLFALPCAAASAPRCKATLETEVDLHRLDDGKYLVPMTLDGKPVWMLLDTSSSVTMLTREAVARLQLKTVLLGNRGMLVSAGKNTITHTATLTTLSLGSHRYTTLIAGVLPDSVTYPVSEVDGKPVIGQFGTEVLSRSDFELFLAERKLRLFDQNHCRGVGAYWATEYAETTFSRDPYGGIYLAMKLENRFVETALSTWSPMTMIDTKVTRQAFDFDETSPGVQQDANGNDQYRAMSLKMPGFDVSDVPIRLVKVPSSCAVHERIDSGSKAFGYGNCLLVYPLRLGRDVLERMRLYVALKERKIYFTEVGARP